MAKFFSVFFKWIIGILLGFLSLVLVSILLFAVFQGSIVNKAVDVINDQQAGEITLESINLRPFLHFPDVSLKLNALDYKLPVTVDDSLNYEPVLNLKELYVALDIVQLIKGNYKVSRINLGDGKVNYTVGADSVSNVEKALGIRFDADTIPDQEEDDNALLSFEIEMLQIRNLTIHYDDIPGKTNASIKINGLQSAFSYYPDTIVASLMMHIDIADASYQDITLDKPRTVSFSSSMIYDQFKEAIELQETMLDLKDALFEAGGRIDLLNKHIDMNFAARNTGIDLLNFLLSGILDLNVIEQVGDGSIALSGNIKGSFEKDSLPVIHTDFSAQELGFYIQSIDKKVSGIQFSGTATNGNNPDLSEAKVALKDFHVDFPDGQMNFDMNFDNLINPEVFIDVDGNADLFVIGQIIETKLFDNLEGNIKISGIVDGKIDQSGEQTFSNNGKIGIDLSDVNLNYENHKIRDLNGTFNVEGENLGIEDLSVNIDGSDLSIESQLNNLLPYLMGYSANPSMGLTVFSKKLDINKILNDSIVDGPVENLSFLADLNAEGSEIRKFIEDGTIPEFELTFQDLNFHLPGTMPVSEVNMQVKTKNELLKISNFGGRIGESDFELLVSLDNYRAFLNADSAQRIIADFRLNSEILRAKDIFTMNDEFTILPDEFVTEEIHDLSLEGKLETTVEEILSDKALPNFILKLNELSWKLKEYPHDFDYFYVDVENSDSLLNIKNFSGYIGESNISLGAQIANLFDTTGIISGFLDIQSDLLDVDELMNYGLLEVSGEMDSTEVDTVNTIDVGLHKIDLPDLALNVDIGEFRFEENNFFEIKGQVRLKPYQIIYLDQLALQTKTGGAVLLDGQFNVTDSSMYNFSASLDIDTLNMSDFNVQLTMEDSIYSLEDNFMGVLSADGIAELFINPDLSVNLDTSTAVFKVKLENGRVRNFAPLHAIARYTGNSDLDNVQFGVLRNSFTLTDGLVYVPLMSISSTIGLILLEGEQGLNGDMLYLARLPTKMIRGTAWNMLSNQQRKEPDEEEEIQKMETQQFAKITIYGKGDILEVKVGDKRDKYR